MALSKIERNKRPGCFERHLQRRYNNPLFPLKRRSISKEELTDARKKDTQNFKDFLKQYTLWLDNVKNINENSSLNDLMISLKDTHYLIVLAATFGGDLEEEISVLKHMEEKFTSIMNIKLPQGTKNIKDIHSLNIIESTPYLAQLKIKDTPILKDEELATLLSEDVNTIRAVGLQSRIFDNFRPNSKDVENLLNIAIKEWLDKWYAKEVIDAFNDKEFWKELIKTKEK